MGNQIFLTLAQVTKLTQIDERTVIRWLQDGYLRGHVLTNDEWCIAPDDLDSFLDCHANRPRENVVPPTAA